MKRLLLGIIIIAIFGIGFLLFYREGSLPVNNNNTSTKTFVINPGEGLNAITKGLAQNQLIRSRVVFYLIVKKLGIEKNIQAGEYDLSPSMNATDIAKALTHGRFDVDVLFKEGQRKEEYAEVVAKNFTVTESEFNTIAPEGYLFPSKYSFPKSATAQIIVDKLTKTFDDVYSKYDAPIKKIGLTKAEAVTLASIVEREARSKEAKQQVASILLKRLNQDMPLQVDATVRYAMGYNVQENDWWKGDISGSLKIDSPFNTYLHPGLPPEPICNPGEDAIAAVAGADTSTPYLFYITGNDNKMHYAKTIEEHDKNIQKYIDNYKE
jgi:UPF0755 protein